MFQHRILVGHDNVEKKALQDASKFAVEAISNIRTVASLRKEEYFVAEYQKVWIMSAMMIVIMMTMMMMMQALAAPHRSAHVRSNVRGIVFGFAQSVPFFAYGGCMFYGGYLVYTEGIQYKIVFKVAEALILGTMMVGQATAFAPNYNKVRYIIHTFY